MTVTTLNLSAGPITLALSADGISLTVSQADPRPSLFAPSSPWNTRRLNPVLGLNALPKQDPWIEEGAYGSKIFYAKTTDKPVSVAVAQVANQLDSGAVTIPHFPADTMPATGQDGHCEILDGDTLHSFYQLKKVPTGWAAAKYARTSASGSGFGTVSNPDNVRAAGCSTAGGLLLASERGLDLVPHALAIGVDKNTLLAGPVYPATLEDYTGHTTYKGVFPMGSLLMLPTAFNVDALASVEAKAIARTLMTYGGYIVDATVGSMNIYAEIGSGWSKAAPADLQAIKDGLRRVEVPSLLRSMNLLSMRGPWKGYGDSKAFGRYDAASDLYLCEATTDARTVYQGVYTHDEADRFGYLKQAWNLNPEPGVKYTVRAIGEGNVTASMAVKKSNYKANYGSTVKLAPSKSATFTWPTDPDTVTEVYVDKPAGGAASIRLELIKA